jgi:hypothetical protein
LCGCALISLAITGFLCASAPEIEERHNKEGAIEARKRDSELYGPNGTALVKLKPVLDEENLSAPWSEGELFTDGGMEIWSEEGPDGCVKEDLSV